MLHFIKVFRKKSYKQLKKILFCCDLVLTLTINSMPNTAIDFFLLSQNEVKLESFYLDSSSKSTICQIISNQKDFNFSPSEVELLYSLSIKYINKSINKKEIKNTILNIRGGDIWGFLDGLITISMIVILIKNDGVLSFGTNKNLIDIHHNRKYNYPSESPSSLKVERPSLVPHAKFISLSQEEKRALYHKYDKNMTHDGYPKLTIGFYQAKYKVRDHGAIHDIDYTIKNNGGTKSLRTDENALKLMDSIDKMPLRNNVKLYENGTYQKGTEREFDAVHICDFDKDVIAVFKKSTGRFVTTCKLTPAERNHLINTGNFRGDKRIIPGQAKNLPPITPINSFQSDVTGVTPRDQSEFDNP